MTLLYGREICTVRDYVPGDVLDRYSSSRRDHLIGHGYRSLQSTSKERVEDVRSSKLSEG